MPTTLRLPLPAPFSLKHAVCSYGYFILAPNRWDGRELHRPLRDADERVVHARIGQIGRSLVVRCDRSVESGSHAILKSQVSRILRLEEEFNPWRKLHPKAARARFERTFRSPTLFEDIVKTMTGCNVSWPNTMNMNRLLCLHVGAHGDFPTPAELARCSPANLKRLCKVGYRAERIIRLSQDVLTRRLDLRAFEDLSRTTDELYEALTGIYGVGPYAAHNILQLLGRYDRLPVDSETLRHFRQFHDVHGDLKKVTRSAERYYARFAPFQFLAYWFELWGDYESRFGKAHHWTEDVHARFTATQLSKEGKP